MGGAARELRWSPSSSNSNGGVMTELDVREFDLTPDPRVLVALTHTPLQPLDALCELIDNSLDSFQLAALQGEPIDYPLITIDLPGKGELNNSEGLVRVRDNGPG